MSIHGPAAMSLRRTALVEITVATTRKKRKADSESESVSAMANQMGGLAGSSGAIIAARKSTIFGLDIFVARPTLKAVRRRPSWAAASSRSTGGLARWAMPLRSARVPINTKKQPPMAWTAPRISGKAVSSAAAPKTVAAHQKSTPIWMPAAAAMAWRRERVA